MKIHTHILALTSVILLTSVSDCAASVDDRRLREPSILLQEGRPAKIPCLINGKHDAYIWMKGNSVENSTEIASFIDGTAGEDNWPFAISENGTLLIETVRLEEEGKYLCRASSVMSDCSGDVIIHVQANLDKFELGVDRCHLQRDCVIFIDPLHANTITCTATNAPHSMHLKWFNGSKEISDGVISRIRDVQGGLSRDISSTLNVVDAHPSSLTCQAVDQNRLNDEGLFVNVLLKAPVTSKKPSPVWMVIAIILLIICLVAVAVIVIMAVRSKKKTSKAVKEQENGELHPLLKEEKENSEKLKAEIKSLKDKQQSDEKENIQVIQKLKTKHENDDKEKDEIIQRLKKKHENDIKEKDEEMNRLKAQKRDDMSEKDAELLRLKEGGVKEKDVEIKRLKAKQNIDISEKDAEIQKLKAKLEKEVKERDAEIHRLKETVIKEKDSELQTLKIKQVNEVKERDAEIRRLKHIITEKEESIRKLIDDLKKTKDYLTNTESYLKSSIRESEKKEETIKNLKGELLEKTNQLKDMLITLKKFQCNEEDKERKLRMDKMKLKDTLQLACKIIPGPGGKEQIKQIKTNQGVTVKLKESVKTANFNLAYTTKADSEEVSQAVCDLTQNAIDGGTSCIISYAASGQDHMVTMTGSFDGRNEGHIMVSGQQLFATAVSLEEKGIKVKLSARYITGKSTSNKDTSEEFFVDYLSDGKKPTNIYNVKKTDVSDIPNEKETLRRFLMHLKGEKSSKTSEVVLVEYSIVTFVDNEVRSSGNISFIALSGLEQLSQCFESGSSYTSELVQIASETIYDENCYSILITHLHGGKKEDSKRTLEFLQKVQTEKRPFFKKLRQSLQKSDASPPNPVPTSHPPTNG